eukprot:2398290-Amphidinium_carterae.3
MMMLGGNQKPRKRGSWMTMRNEERRCLEKLGFDPGGNRNPRIERGKLIMIMMLMPGKFGFWPGGQSKTSRKAGKTDHDHDFDNEE